MTEESQEEENFVDETNETFVDWRVDQRRQAVISAFHQIMTDVIVHSVLPRYLLDSHMSPVAYQMAERIYPEVR